MRATSPTAPSHVWRGPPSDRNDINKGGPNESTSGGGMNGFTPRLPQAAFARERLTDVFEAGPLALASKGTAAPLSEAGDTDTANASQKNPVKTLVDLFKKLLEIFKGAHRDEGDMEGDSNGGGGIADGDIGNTTTA